MINFLKILKMLLITEQRIIGGFIFLILMLAFSVHSPYFHLVVFYGLLIFAIPKAIPFYALKIAQSDIGASNVMIGRSYSKGYIFLKNGDTLVLTTDFNKCPNIYIPLKEITKCERFKFLGIFNNGLKFTYQEQIYNAYFLNPNSILNIIK